MADVNDALATSLEAVSLTDPGFREDPCSPESVKSHKEAEEQQAHAELGQSIPVEHILIALVQACKAGHLRIMRFILDLGKAPQLLHVDPIAAYTILETCVYYLSWAQTRLCDPERKPENLSRSDEQFVRRTLRSIKSDSQERDRRAFLDIIIASTAPKRREMDRMWGRISKLIRCIAVGQHQVTQDLVWPEHLLGDLHPNPRPLVWNASNIQSRSYRMTLTSKSFRLSLHEALNRVPTAYTKKTIAYLVRHSSPQSIPEFAVSGYRHRGAGQQHEEDGALHRPTVHQKIWRLGAAVGLKGDDNAPDLSWSHAEKQVLALFVYEHSIIKGEIEEDETHQRPWWSIVPIRQDSLHGLRAQIFLYQRNNERQRPCPDCQRYCRAVAEHFGLILQIWNKHGMLVEYNGAQYQKSFAGLDGLMSKFETAEIPQ